MLLLLLLLLSLLLTEVVHLVKLSLVIPETSASAERSFCALHGLKRHITSTVGQPRLNLLLITTPVKLTVWKVMIERVTVVKFRVNYGGGNGAGCSEVKVRADTAKFTNVIVARLRKCSDLIREGKVFVENKTKVASGVGCNETAVLYFR